MRSTARFALALWLAALFSTTLPVAAERPTELITFELEDASGATHSAESFAGTPLLIVAADGAGSDFTDAWTAAVRDALVGAGFEGPIRIVGLADLRAVPSFMRAKIRKSMATETGGPLLDWRGVFAKAYGFERRHCNLLLFDADGRLLGQTAGREVDVAEAQRLANTLSLPAEASEPAEAAP